MSQTRNQRRRGELLHRIALILMTLLLIASIAFVVHMWIRIERLQDQMDARDSGPAYYAGAILPTSFDREAYEIALQRYDVEHGLVDIQYIVEEAK